MVFTDHTDLLVRNDYILLILIYIDKGIPNFIESVHENTEKSVRR